MAKVSTLPKRQEEEDNYDSPPQNDQEVIDSMKDQVKLLNQGFIVQVVDVKSCDESSSFVTMRVTLNSCVNQMPVFGEVKLRLTKQVVSKMYRELARVS